MRRNELNWILDRYSSASLKQHLRAEFMGKTVKDINFKGTFNNWCRGPIDNAMTCIFYGPGFYPRRRENFFCGRFVLFFRGLFLALSREINGYFSLQLILKK